MKKQKTRSEISDKYKWDLTRIYKTDEDWNNDFNKLKELSKDIEKYEYNLFESKDNLENYLILSEKLEKLENKLESYASLHQSEDATNVTYQKMTNDITDLVMKINEKDSFFDELFYKTEFSKIEEYAKESEIINLYLEVFRRKLRYKDHYLPKDKEKLVSKILKPMYASGEIYSMLTDAEFKFGNIKDEEGNEVELTESNFSNYLASKNRRVREDAFKGIYKKYGEFKNTITLTYTSDIDASIALNKVYNFDSVRKSSLYSDNIDIKVYDNLIDSVHNNLDKLFKYFALKKKLLNLDEIHLYDLYTKVIDEDEKNYTYEEAKELVLKALNPLGEDYLEKAKSIFDNRLVDVYNNIGKRGGAFSSGTYDTEPYMLLNYEGKVRDVSTIAHELGHSMHTTYSNLANPRPYSNYRIFVAEVASTVNELLLAFYMLDNSQSKVEKLLILNELLDNYKATIYRQTMFAEFEKEMYRRRENEESLSHEDIEKYYYDLNKLYFGKDVVVDDEIKYEWERIPHFYTAFYVYKYATSMSAATYIADKIYNGDTKFRDKYIEFLKSGNSKYPVDELKDLGLDMTNEKVVNEALDKFAELTEKFEDLLDSQKDGEVNGNKA